MSSRRSAPLPVAEIADGVWAIGPWGYTYTVVYLVESRSGWALVDAGWRGDGDRIEAALATVTGAERPHGIYLTHDHPDHEGDARALAERWGCPVWVSRPELPIARRDFDAMLATAMPLDRWVILPAMRLVGAGRRRRIFAAATLEPVVRGLDLEGEVPGMQGWRAVPSPGHTLGHVSFFRARGRVLLSGDALVTARIDTVTHLLMRRQGLSGPPWYTTWDAGAARSSMVRLAALAPEVVGGGHGAPMTGPGTAEAVTAFVARRRGPGPGRPRGGLSG